MKGITRRTCIAMGSVPVLAGVGAYVTGERGLRRADAVPRIQRVDAGSARARLQQRHLPNLPLVTHDGDKVRFYDDLVKDKKVVLTFVSSRAPADSAKVMDNLARIQRFFGGRVGRDIFLYSIARTPARDTPAVLKTWAARYGAGPGWAFLTGRPSTVESLRRSLGFASEDPAEDAGPAFSVGLLRHGIEREMRWAHCQAQAAPGVIAHSMLLDFGPGPTDPNARITWNLNGAAGPGSAPVWNCKLLLAGLD